MQFLSQCIVIFHINPERSYYNMPKKELNQANSQSEEKDSSIVSTPVEPAIVPSPIDIQDPQLVELTKVAESLRDAVFAMQAQSARNAEFRKTIDTLKEATRAIMLASSVGTPPPDREIIPIPTPVEQNCSEGPCGCVSKNCCCFDIVMSYVRVLGMQPLEAQDSNANPWGELEVRMFAYLDGGIGAVIPSMFSTLALRKLVQSPGLKVRIDRVIGTVCLPKGKTKTITIGVDAIEEDSGLVERATGGRDEEGSNSSIMVLDCCCNVPPSTVFDISFTSGGQGGGAIEVEFTAIKKC
jgi:hypothetical protein